MTDPYRAMCAELLAWADHASSHYYIRPALFDRARALLAQPEPEVKAMPNDDDAWFNELVGEIARVQHVAAGEGQGPRFDLAETVARCCHPTPQPEPEGERPSASDLLPVDPPIIPTTMAMQYRSAWREGVEDGWNEARATLARWGRPTPQPPADGEVES